MLYMIEKNVLLIFTKNPQPGKCKTRLASTIGDEKALEIYKILLNYTADFCKKVNAQKHVYYSDYINYEDCWENNTFQKFLQTNGDLGEKMNDAFEKTFNQGYKKVIIIGTDCAEINQLDINKAFEQLTNHEVVIGPAMDGGYYLLGMNDHIPKLFTNKNWSTPTLLQETISTLEELNISFDLLPEKSDIDNEEDLKRNNYLKNI